MDSSAVTLIVRLARSGEGGWTGVVERVRTGEKYRVGDLEAIGTLISRIVEQQVPQLDKSSQPGARFSRIVDP